MMRLITLILFIFITNFLTGVRSFADDFTETVAPPSVIFEVLALNKDLPTLKKPKYRSPTDMATSPDETKIYICEQTAKRITVFDVGTKTVEPDRIRLPNEVTGCVVSNDHTKLFATIGSEWWPTGYVCVVDMASRRVTNRIPAGHYPRCPVLSPDGTMLYIANMFSNDVTVIDVGTETVAKTIDVVREPYSMGITPDGKTLIVGNSLPDERSTDTMFVSCKVSIIDLASGTQDTIRLTHGHSRGSHSVYGLTVEPTGRYAFVTHLIGKFYLVASTVEKGWLQTNNLAMIDIKERKFINDVSLDLLNCGLANPWGVKCTRDGQYMIIAHAGANELSLINLPRMIDTVLARSAKGEDLQREFTVLKECRKRLQVITKGPRALAIAGTSVFTTGYFDDAAATMEEFLLDTSRSRPIGTYVIGEPQPWNGERNGENNFFDASLCFQKWQSCHSCHPFTRPCALNWILGGGAMVAPKNAKSMLYSWWTPPTTWTGCRGHAEKSIPAAIELEQFRIAEDDLALPLDTFIMYLKQTPSPHLIKGRLSEAALRGKALFSGEKAGCFNCHKAPLYCDLLFHNIGVPDPYDANTEWDTPSLIEAWRTGPYGHLGSFQEIEEMVKLPGHNNASSMLSSEDMEDLLQYVLSL